MKPPERIGSGGDKPFRTLVDDLPHTIGAPNGN
jgi:hypothetical protein